MIGVLMIGRLMIGRLMIGRLVVGQLVIATLAAAPLVSGRPTSAQWMSGLRAAAPLAVVPAATAPRVGETADTLAALIVLGRQADIATLDKKLKERHASRKDRHSQVIAALRSEAEQGQAGLLELLSALRRRGEVSSYTPYWITNAIAVRATPEAIEDLARRPEVLAIEPRPVFTVDESLRAEGSCTPSRSNPSARGIGVSGGVRAIRAPQVWNDLLINGTGALIGILDTGVDGNHPALRDRWRGNNGHPWQECWHDVVNSGSTYPNDDVSGHGTHVAGIATGLGTATHDTIGVAWGAQWIAANAIRQGAGAELDFDVIDCLQWFADPDGDPETIDDVPDVIVCAWGVNEQLAGYSDCDTRWWWAIDNCEAAGVVTIWSAGGDGPGAGTVRSPADRATTPYSGFSVGSVDAAHSAFPYPIAFFSSRGPSGCDAPDSLRIKPEVVAPGVEIYSSVPGGGYQVWSGSAMATAHAAGLVALMRSANPDLEVDAIKQTMMMTARDGGAAGEDNAYGWGTIDAFEAVSPFATPSASPDEALRANAPAVPPAWPNPLGPDGAVRYRIRASGPITLEIHDPAGRLVRAISIAPVPPGTERVAVWDGRDADGRPVPSGLYLCRIRSADGCAQAKTLVVR